MFRCIQLASALLASLSLVPTFSNAFLWVGPRGGRTLDAYAYNAKMKSTSQRNGLTKLWRIRGGSLNDQSSDDSSKKPDSTTNKTASPSSWIPITSSYSQERGMSISLAVTYLTVMGAKCALPSVLSLLTSTTTGLTFPAGTIPSELIAKQLTISTMAIAAGKLLLGPVIDYFGGVFSLKVALISLSAAMGIISISQSFQVFALAWIFVDFIFSSCWAACIHAIHQTFPRHQWAPQIGNLAAAARTGNAAAFTLFAWVLHIAQPFTKQTWRPVFGIAAILQLVPVLLLTKFGNVKQTDLTLVAARPTLTESLKTVRDEATTVDFWLHLISRSALMVFASFLLFIPTLMTQVYGTTPAVASQVGSVFALGCLLSVTTGSAVFPTLLWPGKMKMVSALLGTGILSSIGQLGHVSGWWKLSSTMSTTLLFLWGLAVAIPFYLPPSLYALEKGRSSATIADAFDVGGFSLLAFFNGYVASIQHSNPEAWVGTFQLTTLCAMTSFFSLSLAIWREGQLLKKERRSNYHT